MKDKINNNVKYYKINGGIYISPITIDSKETLCFSTDGINWNGINQQMKEKINTKKIIKERYIAEITSKPYLSSVCGKTFWCIKFIDNLGESGTQIRRHSKDILAIKKGYKLEISTDWLCSIIDEQQQDIREMREEWTAERANLLRSRQNAIILCIVFIATTVFSIILLGVK